MDTELLQGTWRISALIVEGAYRNASGIIIVEGDRLTTRQIGAEYSGRIELNPSAMPKTLAMRF